MESRTITVEGLRTRVVVEDGGVGRDPIVLIHGVGGWAETWRAVMRPLAETGRRVLALDLPGFGESERPGRVRYFDPKDPFYPSFVLAAMDELGVRSAHVIGQSMGGAVAFMTGVSAPARTRSLVLVAPGGVGRDVPLFLRLCALPGFGLIARLPRSRDAARDVLATCFHDPGLMTPELIEEAFRYGNASFPEFVRALGHGVGLRGVRPALRGAWIARASRHTGPVLVLWGREDRVLPVRHAGAVREVFPNAEVRLVERCGHLLMAERPDEFLAATLPFLARAEEAVAA